LSQCILFGTARFYRFSLNCGSIDSNIEALKDMMQGTFSRNLLLLLGLVCFLFPGKTDAQLISPIYGWHAYLSYFSINSITHRGDRVYAATEGGIFSYSPESRAYRSYSTINGMSSLSPTTIYTDQESGMIYVGYQDGNVNTIDSNDVIGYITDISRSTLFTTLRINQFTSAGGLLYIATEFGIVVFDIEKDETRYSITKIGTNQSGLPVSDIAISQGRLWASLAGEGLFSASLSEANITLPEVWVRESDDRGLPEGLIPFICNTGDSMYASLGDTIFYLPPDGSQWSYAPFPFETWNFVGASEGQVFACVRSESYLQRLDGSLMMKDNFGTVVTCYATGDTIWSGDFTSGMQWFPPQGNRIFASPPGPLNEFVTDMVAAEGQLYIAPRGKKGTSDRFYDKSGIPYYSFLNGGWTIVSHRNGKLSTDSVWQDFARTYFDERTGECYIGSFAEGIVVLKEGEVQRIYNSDNSGLIEKFDRNRVSGLVTDDAGNLWVTQMVNDFPIHVLTPEGNWYRYRPTNMDPIGIILDDYDNKWIINQKQGLVVYSDNFTPDNPNDDMVKRLTTDFGQGGLIDNDVFAIAQDLDEQIWVGTASGITIFYDPSIVWTNDFQDAACPIIDGFCLLRDQKVSDIVVDAANRKWISTENGVYQVNEDGTELLRHFTVKNSPLPDNDVKAIALDQSTGEVFFGTAKGVVSFMGDAIQGKPELAENLYAFPNPVTEDYPGVIMLKNMDQESTVKITSAAGMVVRELASLGGEVTWDMRDTYGKRVPPGVYLVMVATADGESAGITKLAILEKQF